MIRRLKFNIKEKRERNSYGTNSFFVNVFFVIAKSCPGSVHFGRSLFLAGSRGEKFRGKQKVSILGRFSRLGIVSK